MDSLRNVSHSFVDFLWSSVVFVLIWKTRTVQKRHNITHQDCCSGNPRPAASYTSGLQRGGPGFPPRTFHEGLGLIYIHVIDLYCAAWTLLDLGASCCVLPDFKELTRHTALFNGALASHLGYFSLAITRTLSSSAAWTLPHFSPFFVNSVSANIKRVYLLKSPDLASCVQCWRCFILLSYQACVFFFLCLIDLSA